MAGMELELESFSLALSMARRESGSPRKQTAIIHPAAQHIAPVNIRARCMFRGGDASCPSVRAVSALDDLSREKG